MGKDVFLALGTVYSLPDGNIDVLGASEQGKAMMALQELVTNRKTSTGQGTENRRRQNSQL